MAALLQRHSYRALCGMLGT